MDKCNSQNSYWEEQKGLSSVFGHTMQSGLLTYCFLEVLIVVSLLSTGLAVILSLFLITQSCGDLRILGVLFYKPPA